MSSAILTLLLCLPSGAQEPTVIAPELREVLDVAPAEHHRAYVVMQERMTLADFEGRVDDLPRGDRQRFVMNELRAYADASQHAVLEALDALRADGYVSHVHQLWINNSIQIRANRAAVRSLAGLPGVARIMYDPDRDLLETADVPLFFQDPVPRGNGGPRTVFYTEGFESGSFDSEWATTTTGCGDIRVTGQEGPMAGSYHALMDSTSNGCFGTATMTLTVDLSSATSAQLRFGFLDLNDEFNIGSDILEASDDGGNSWTKVADLDGANGQYITETHDLDPLGLSYVSNFKIRWSWYDNFSAPTDGFAFDEIEIADNFPPPPPPTPEPNIVMHQAPDLWAIGYDGQGSVIVNIDSGCDRFHPDLENRIWNNPNDPVDGIDNDNNGYVDDWWGWNFSSNNNDPGPSGTHGTNTAGIMVGDGSSLVRATGMAPGALMAVCRISGESDHMASQQWSISVGADCNSSSHSYKWPFSPRPDYHLHRATTDMTLAAGIVHANSIGNQGNSQSSYPIPFNISAPGNGPTPWVHPEQVDGGVSGVIGCCGINLLDDSHYTSSGRGPSAWEDITNYDPIYPHSQNASYWDYPYGGFGGGQPGLLKPDIAGYTSGPMTTTNGTGYSSFSGTSCATPHVGGAIALLISANPNLLPRQISQALQENAEDKGPAGKDTDWGAGKMLVFDAALRVLHLVTADDITPSLGQTVTATMNGPPNAQYALYFSTDLGSTSLGGIGTLELDNAQLLQLDFLDASGTATFSRAVPNNSGLIGRSVYLQSVADDTLGASGTYLFSLVEEMVVQA